jgi:hypothetical protein
MTNQLIVDHSEVMLEQEVIPQFYVRDQNDGQSIFECRQDCLIVYVCESGTLCRL